MDVFSLLTCYLSGRHDYSVTCEPGVILLRCIHCGKRSAGWELQHAHAAPQVKAPVVSRLPVRVLPFSSRTQEP